MVATKDRPPQDSAASPRPGPLAAPARISSNLRQESQMPPFPLRRSKPVAKASVCSGLQTLLPAQKVQHLYFHSLPHSLQHEQNVTPAFPAHSALFLRSLARVQVSTLLFSCAHAL